MPLIFMPCKLALSIVTLLRLALLKRAPARATSVNCASFRFTLSKSEELRLTSVNCARAKEMCLYFNCESDIIYSFIVIACVCLNCRTAGCPMHLQANNETGPGKHYRRCRVLRF